MKTIQHLRDNVAYQAATAEVARAQAECDENRARIDAIKADRTHADAAAFARGVAGESYVSAQTEINELKARAVFLDQRLGQLRREERRVIAACGADAGRSYCAEAKRHRGLFEVALTATAAALAEWEGARSRAAEAAGVAVPDGELDRLREAMRLLLATAGMSVHSCSTAPERAAVTKTGWDLAAQSVPALAVR